MARRLALIAVAISSGLILVLSFVGTALGELAFAIVAMGIPALLMIVGAARRKAPMGPAVWPIAGLFVVLELSLLGMLAFRGQVGSGPWLLGLPVAAAIQMYGLLVLPLALVTLGFALTFAGFGVTDDDLERLRRLSRHDLDE